MNHQPNSDSEMKPGWQHVRRPAPKVRLFYRVLSLAALVLFVCVFCLIVLVLRVDRFNLDVTQGHRSDSAYNAENDIWLIVGTDDRRYADDNLTELGPDEDNPGRRADIMFLARPTESGVNIMSVQRDIEVTFKNGTDRLNFMLLDSEQRLADAYCHDLHVPIDHMMIFDMDGFISIVDALGGVEVESRDEVRDPLSGLELHPGQQTLNGRGALALVRSRHPQYLVDGKWKNVDEFQGSMQRVASSAEVMRQVAQKAASVKSPVTAAKLAWALSGAVSIDSNTSLTALSSLAKQPVKIDTLQVRSAGRGLRTSLTTEAIDQLADSGFVGLCEADIDDTNFPTAQEVELRRSR